MTIYYRGPDVLITDQVFMVRRPNPILFRIALLRAAYIICWGGRFLRLTSTAERELRAMYGSCEVTLYRSRDPITFGQVQRGLLRALERHEQRRHDVP
jgi:hypothetical protein